jgi:hypothetical protein
MVSGNDFNYKNKLQFIIPLNTIFKTDNKIKKKSYYNKEIICKQHAVSKVLNILDSYQV